MGSGKGGVAKKRNAAKETGTAEGGLETRSEEAANTDGQGEGVRPPTEAGRKSEQKTCVELRNWHEKKAEPSRGAPPFPAVTARFAAGRSVSRAFQLPANPAPPPIGSDCALFDPPAGLCAGAPDKGGARGRDVTGRGETSQSEVSFPGGAGAIL